MAPRILARLDPGQIADEPCALVHATEALAPDDHQELAEAGRDGS
jgi:hypothetical protein